MTENQAYIYKMLKKMYPHKQIKHQNVYNFQEVGKYSSQMECKSQNPDPSFPKRNSSLNLISQTMKI